MREIWIWSLGWEDSLEKWMLPTPVFLPGEFHGQRSLVGYSPRGHKESEMTEQLSLTGSHVFRVTLSYLNNIGISSNLVVYSLTLLKCFSSYFLPVPPTHQCLPMLFNHWLPSLYSQAWSWSLSWPHWLARVSLSPSLRLIMHLIPTIYFHIASCYFSSIFTYICLVFPMKL